MKLRADQALRVLLREEAGDRLVGRLAWRDRRAWFEFDAEYREAGPSLSPFRLPMRAGVIEAPTDPFWGLFGLFDDSLPDGWGRLLQNRRATAMGLPPTSLTPLDRLAWVGRTALGALAYEPELGEPPGEEPVDLDRLAQASEEVLEGAADDILPELLRLGGSPQGARPKVLVWLRPSDFHVAASQARPSEEHVRVMVKFRARSDRGDAGAQEFAYHRMALAAGLSVPSAWLVPSHRGGGWFAVARFDRTETDAPRHIHTLCGLLHADHRLPSLDYVAAMAATHRLCGDQRAVVEMFRRMVFNVVAHNRDDHTKQTSFRMQPDGTWGLAPAYDLTFSEGPGGEHSMAIAGQGRPDRGSVLEVAKQAGIPKRTASQIVEHVSTAVMQTWPEVAPSTAAQQRIGQALRPLTS